MQMLSKGLSSIAIVALNNLSSSPFYFSTFNLASLPKFYLLFSKAIQLLQIGWNSELSGSL
jgi:hypothetical protein